MRASAGLDKRPKVCVDSIGQHSETLLTMIERLQDRPAILRTGEPLGEHLSGRLHVELKAICVAASECLVRASCARGKEPALPGHLEHGLVPLEHPEGHRQTRKDRVLTALAREENLEPAVSFIGDFRTGDPQAFAIIWAPRHTPRTGRPASTALRKKTVSSLSKGYRASSYTFLGPPIETAVASSCGSRRILSPAKSRRPSTWATRSSRKVPRVPGPSASAWTRISTLRRSLCPSCRFAISQRLCDDPKTTKL